MSSADSLDDLVRGAYEKFRDRGLSVDDILVDPEEAIAFADSVTSQVPSVRPLTRPDVLRRLIALRKRGQARGGLPRVEREYHGRHVRPL